MFRMYASTADNSSRYASYVVQYTAFTNVCVCQYDLYVVLSDTAVDSGAKKNGLVGTYSTCSAMLGVYGRARCRMVDRWKSTLIMDVRVDWLT